MQVLGGTARRGACLLAAAATGTALAACGQGSDAAGTAPVATGEPERAFAPLVRLHPREESFPISATRLLANAGLEWRGGPCKREEDVTRSAELEPGQESTLAPLDPSRLGREPRAYRARPKDEDCDRTRAEVYTTTQRTRPFDTDDRPVGLGLDEGFWLDIASGVLAGDYLRTEEGAIKGTPAYYGREREWVDGQPGLRLSYWLLFGREVLDKGERGQLFRHEGDWDRVDVLVQKGSGRPSYTPVAVEYHLRHGIERVAWDDVKRFRDTHPVAYLDSGMHTPRPTGDCDDGCAPWRTWLLLLDVREEPWWGYGGGWGAIGESDEESGPSGPSPFVIGGPSR